MNQDALRKARLWLAVVFLVGAAIGGVFGYSFGHRSYAAIVTTPHPTTEPERRAKRLADMTKEIGFTPDQAAKVDGIIRTAHENMKDLREKCEKDVDLTREKARDQIRALLTDEQKPKFESMVRRMDQERKAQQQSQQPK